VFNGSPFNKHNRNHAGNPARQFPVKAEGVQKCVPDNSTQKSGNPHTEKIDFEIEKNAFGPV
jgi:hypothetical protein